MKEIIEVGDVNIAVIQSLGLNSLFEYFDAPKKRFKFFRPKEHAELIIDVDPMYNYLDQPTRKLSPNLYYYENKLKMKIQIIMQAQGISVFEKLKHIGYLAGLVSDKYRFCHAAGLILNGKGVLLIGQSGHGKSSLASILEGEVLDDDFLLVSSEDMRKVGKFGWIRKDDKQDCPDRIEDDNHNSKLNIVLLLNKNHDPDYVRRIAASNIMAESTFDYDYFHGDLFDAYKKRMPINFEVPIYEVGTKGHREGTASQTKKIIEDLVFDV